MGCPTTYDGYTVSWTRGKLAKLTKGLKASGIHNYYYNYNALGQRTSRSYTYSLPTLDTSAVVAGMLTGYSQAFRYDQSGRLVYESKTNQYYGEGSGTEKKVYLYDETGIIGMVVASYLHSHCVKKELVAYLGIILLAIPFSLALCWLGIINATVITAVMCAVVFFLAPAHMFSSQFNAKFSRYGKNGTAAGIANCAMSLSIVAESYGFNLLAEKYGWIAVTIPCVVLLVVAATLTAVALGQWNRFSKE